MRRINSPLADVEPSREIVAGRLRPGAPLVSRPPFCAPHHTATVAAIVGGGSGLAQPGAVSLAHRGVLFLDEAPLFSARVLDALREPLESGWVTLDLTALKLDTTRPFQAHDLLTGARHTWHGPRNFVQLNPLVAPAHILKIRRRVRTERDFEYYL